MTWYVKVIYLSHLFQLPKEALVASLPCLMKLLKATSLVVHSYAAHTIERLLMVRTPDGKTAA